jgi:ABC-2 type transport system ATP-binding protein
MSEMSLTADHVIVIGRGHLIADAPMRDLLVRGASTVAVRSPDAARLASLIVAAGGQVVEHDGEDALTVSEFTAEAVGELAARHGVVLHELVTERASLEETFFELTNDSVDFHGEVAATGSNR